MIDFPSSPTIGQTLYVPGNGITYRWDGTLWLAGPNVGPGYGPTGDFFAAVVSSGFGATPVTCLWPANSIVSGNSGNWYNPTNGRYTPPAGRYHIFSSIGFGLTTSATYGVITLRKNGVAVISASQTPGAASWQGDPSVQVNVDANGTDWFDITMSANNGTNINCWLWFGAFPIAGAKGPPGDQGAPGLPGSLNGWRQIQRIVPAVAQASIDFTNIPSDVNELVCKYDIVPTTDNVNLWFTMYDAAGVIDNGAHYAWSAVIDYSSHSSATYSNLIASTSAISGNTGVVLSYPPSTGCVGAAQGIGGKIEMFNIRNTTRYKNAIFHSSHIAQNAGYSVTLSGSVCRLVNGAVTGLRLAFGAGNVAAGGSATLWGSP